MLTSDLDWSSRQSCDYMSPRVTMSPRKFQLGTEFIGRTERMCASSTAILSHGERQVYANTCQSPCSCHSIS